MEALAGITDQMATGVISSNKFFFLKLKQAFSAGVIYLPCVALAMLSYPDNQTCVLMV